MVIIHAGLIMGSALDALEQSLVTKRAELATL
jgi:hypothetical protein